MKLLFLTLVIILLNRSIVSSDNDLTDLSKIKLCETKISELEKTSTLLPIKEIDECLNGVQPARVRGYQRNFGFINFSYKNVVFQIHQADSTIYKIILNSNFTGYLTDGTYVDLKTFKAKDIDNKKSVYWFRESCTEYIGVGYDNIKFHIVENESILPKNDINQEYYSDKKIELVTIEKSCYKWKK